MLAARTGDHKLWRWSRPIPGALKHPIMRKVTALILLAAACVAGISSLAAQPPPAAKKVASTGGNSLHETASTVVNGNRVTIVYGRPAMIKPGTTEVRKIWGGLVPYDQVWRTGSDEATLLITQQAIEMGGVTIPAGAYSLRTLPAADGSAKLIVNKQIGQWGVPRTPADMKSVYDEALDVVRVELQKETLAAPVVLFKMSVDRAGAIKMSWETTQYSVPFTVKK